LSTVSLAAAIAIATVALAQPVDPCADSDRKPRAERYLAYREEIMNGVKLFFFAEGCRVLLPSQGSQLTNFYTRPLFQSPQMIMATPQNPNETAHIVQLIEAAGREGYAHAREPGACDWFKANPEVVRSLRGDIERGLH
jgi:hypothetical protein